MLLGKKHIMKTAATPKMNCTAILISPPVSTVLELSCNAGCAVDNNCRGHKQLENIDNIVHVEPWIILKADVEAFALRVVV